MECTHRWVTNDAEHDFKGSGDEVLRTSETALEFQRPLRVFIPHQTKGSGDK